MSEQVSAAVKVAAANGPQKFVHGWRCKRKQYDGVRAALSFLFPLLTAWSASDDAAARSGISDSDADLIRGITESCIAPSLRHAGPLPSEYLSALQNEAWSDCLTAVLSTFPAAALTDSSAAGLLVNLLPAPCTTLSLSGQAALWTDELIAHYIRCLTEIHNARPSRDLSAEGYLKEAGLLSHRVFAAGPASEPLRQRWAPLIDAYTLFVPDRSHIHEMENMPQEIGIGELVAECCAAIAHGGPTRRADFSLELIVDVGGGNGILAAQAGERLGCSCLVVDPFFPSHAIDCCPRVWADTADRQRPATHRAQSLRRIAAFFHETDWDSDIGADPDRCAFIAKHLCGTAVDTCLAWLDVQGRLPRILILVPCCFTKGVYGEYVNKPFLRRVLGVEDQDGFSAMTRLTDWNSSVYQKEAGAPPAGTRYSATGLDRRGRPSPKSIGSVVSCGEALAKAIETLVNRGRMQWLEERSYTTALREYVPDCVSPKNKCIIAYRP